MGSIFHGFLDLEIWEIFQMTLHFVLLSGVGFIIKYSLVLRSLSFEHLSADRLSSSTLHGFGKVMVNYASNLGITAHFYLIPLPYSDSPSPLKLYNYRM